MGGSISEAVPISGIGNRPTFDQATEQFLAVLRRRGRSPATIRAYRWGIGTLGTLLRDGGVELLADVGRAHLERWQDYLLDKGMAEKTRQLAATAVRELVKWAVDEELMDWRLVRVIEKVRTVPGLPRPIPVNHLERIHAYIGPRRLGMTEVQLRDRALFTALLVTGARISEVLRLTRHQVEDGGPVVVRQKGGTEKELLVTPTMRQRIVDYLAARPDDLPQLWVSVGRGRSGGRQVLTRSLVIQAWRQLAKRVGVPKWTSHQLRHTCATELKRAGVADLVIADHLGHRNLASLPNYAQVVDEHRQAKLEVLEGLLSRGLDTEGPVGGRFRVPAKIRGRPDNRRRVGSDYAAER